MTFDRDKLVKNLANDMILVPYLDKVFAEFDDPWTFDYTEKEVDDAWHPSGDCTPLASELYQKALNHGNAGPRQISGGLRKAFMVGHFWHQLIQHVVVAKLGFCTPDQIERKGMNRWDTLFTGDLPHPVTVPKPFHWVTGSGDFAPLTAPNGWSGIVDIKTMSSTDYKKASTTGLLPARFEIKYICQMNIYMRLFDQPQAMILGINKDSPHAFTEFTFVRNDDLIAAIYDKWKFVSQCLDEGREPTKEEDEEYSLPIGVS